MVEETERLTVAPYLERLVTLGIGILANQVQIWAFDWVLYPFVVWQLGLVFGGLIMTCLSCLLCYLLLRFYDWTKKDWLGIEAIKGLKDVKGKSWMARLSSWILRKGDSAAMIFLAIKFDPFITTAYMRHGSHRFNGLSRRDWKIFFGSLLIGNAYWTFAVFSGVSILEWLWQGVSSTFL